MTASLFKFPRALLLGVIGLAGVVLVSGSQVGAAEAPVGLGTAGSFAVLAGSTVTNTGPSVISGELGVSPGTAIVGFPPGIVNNGTIHSGDAVAAQAQADLTTAYNDAAGRSVTANIASDLSGQTLVSGVYRAPTLALGVNSTVTLDAQGDPSAVFIFQAGSTLITGSASVVSLINGADACNVFWQVGSSATLGTNSVFVGNILALTSVTANTGATVAGRLLARNGAVTLDTNRVTRARCTAGATTTTSAPAETTTTTAEVTTTTTTATTDTTIATTDTTIATTDTTIATTGTTIATTGTTTPTATTTTATTAPIFSTTASTSPPLAAIPVTTATAGQSGTTAGIATASGPGTAGAASTTATASGASRGTTTAGATGTSSASGSSGDNSTATARTPLARTGSQLTSTAVAGVVAIILGFGMLRRARPKLTPAPVRSYRC